MNTCSPGPRTGLTALADYTMLAEPDNPVITQGGEDRRLLKHRHQVDELPAREPGALEIEVWSYAPNLLAKGRGVNHLLLHLSLKESQDEQVEAMIEK